MKNSITFLILVFFPAFGLMAQKADMAGSLNSFSIDLYKQLKTEKENLFFSPVSINIALNMANEGAKSDTRAAFEKVLHIDPNVSDSETIDFMMQLKNFKDSSNYLNISNAIWIQDNFKINADFRDKIQTKYSSEAFQVDFLNENNSALQINKWVSEKTNHLIPEIISPAQIDDSTKLVITNAIYFIGTWLSIFDKELTREDDFYSIENQTVRLDFMHSIENLDYFENKDFQFISKEYDGYDKSFCVILPADTYGISEIETRLDNSLINSIFNNITNVGVDLTLPKFKMETGYSLNEPLINLGLGHAFDNSADFTGISPYPRLKIDKVNHKAFIEIDEEETEAAAATTVMYDLAGYDPRGRERKPKVFKADHPFIFMIIDNKTKGILFIGRFVKENK
jgi:serpin B